MTAAEEAELVAAAIAADADGEVAEEPALPYHIDFRALTRAVLEECVVVAPPKALPGKCTIAWINFDYKKFKEACPQYPALEPRRQSLYSNHPFLKTSFGYSPKVQTDERGIETITNNLRLEFSDYIDNDGREYEEWCKMVDDFWIDKYMANVASSSPWPRCGIKGTITRDAVYQKYKSIYRQPETAGFAYYKSMHFKTPPANKMEAIVDMYDGNREPVHYSTLPKDYYCRGFFQFQKLFFGNDSWGPSLQVDLEQYDSVENLRTKGVGKKRACPFTD